jgi:hypothetical protein
MLALILALLAGSKVELAGDVQEYALLTIAVANHGTPDIRAGDIDDARTLMPGFGPSLDVLVQGMQSGQDVPQPGFYRGRDGVQAIHFFGYSALAAIPYKLLKALHLPPMKCYQVVNLSFVLVLSLSLLRLFRSTPKALAGTALYMLCGGYLYWRWTSPEVASSAALLAGMVWFCCGAPLLGGLMIGIAAMQNPTIVLAAGAAPLLACCLHYRREAGLRANLLAALRPRVLLGVALGVALFALSPLHNLHQFGIPSIIARVAAAPELISLVRLHSLFFDLNQGMIIAVPGVLLVLLWLALRAAPGQRLAHAAALLLVCLLMVAFALPALSIGNWNSGAAGVMRYAFWCAMPLLFLLLWRLQQAPRWPLALVVVLAVVQTAAMAHAHSYGHIEFSPLAKWVMRHAPSLYNPEPEIFAERAMGAEGVMDPAKVYAYQVDGVAVKSMVSLAHPHPEQLCGKDSMVNGKMTRSVGQWAYVNGALACGEAVRVAVPAAPLGQVLLLGSGWSVPELTDGKVDGVWSEGEMSRLVIAYGPERQFRQLSLTGNYFDGNERTRVTINGVDLGWQTLHTGTLLTIPPQDRSVHSLTVELRHESPRSPGPQDGRKLALFLREAQLR